MIKRFDYNTASPDELRAEADRRLAKRLGRKVAPSPQDVERIDKQLEKAVQAEVVKEYRRCGCTVWSTSQPRKAKFITPGGADLIVFSPAELFADGSGTMWFHEVKPDGKPYRDDQLLFAAACRTAGIDCIGGGLAAAIEKLERLNLRGTPRPQKPEAA